MEVVDVTSVRWGMRVQEDLGWDDGCGVRCGSRIVLVVRIVNLLVPLAAVFVSATDSQVRHDSAVIARCFLGVPACDGCRQHPPREVFCRPDSRVTFVARDCFVRVAGKPRSDFAARLRVTLTTAWPQ